MSRTLARASAVLAASALAVPLWAVPVALAEESSEAASVGAYFFRGGITQQGLPVEAPQPPPNATADADGVSPGNLAVAAQGSQEDKVSFLGFSLAAVPLDASISRAVLTVPLVPAAPPEDVVVNAAPEKVRACKAGDSGFFGEDAASITLAPARLCQEFASQPGKATADGKAYEFDITGLAATWLTANDGVALTVAEGVQDPFQVVFAPSDQATLKLTYTAPSLPVAAPVDTSVGGGVPVAGGFGLDGGTALPSFDTGGVGSVDAPVVDTAAPAVTAPEAAPAPVTAPTGVVPVAAGLPTVSSAPPVAFWVALAAFAGLLALLGLIMGDPRVPVAAAGRQSRLSQALQSRQSAGARPAAEAARRPAIGRALGV